MVDYEVLVDNESGSFVVKGPFDQDAIPVEIPLDDVNRKQFVDLFLHKGDIERGIDFLRCISIDKNIIVNEGLFIAGLNNCMKCFKYSKSRSKLDKNIVFAGNQDLLENFIVFEKMRDQHFDHDENGMLQATAFLLASPKSEKAFGGSPSVVWNRTMLDYYNEGQRLQGVMQYIWLFLCQEIDRTGDLIENTYINYSKEDLISLKTPQIELASTSSKRK